LISRKIWITEKFRNLHTVWKNQSYHSHPWLPKPKCPHKQHWITLTTWICSQYFSWLQTLLDHPCHHDDHDLWIEDHFGRTKRVAWQKLELLWQNFHSNLQFHEIKVLLVVWHQFQIILMISQIHILAKIKEKQGLSITKWFLLDNETRHFDNVCYQINLLVTSESVKIYILAKPLHNSILK